MAKPNKTALPRGDVYVYYEGGEALVRPDPFLTNGKGEFTVGNMTDRPVTVQAAFLQPSGPFDIAPGDAAGRAFKANLHGVYHYKVSFARDCNWEDGKVGPGKKHEAIGHSDPKVIVDPN